MRGDSTAWRGFKSFGYLECMILMKINIVYIRYANTLARGEPRPTPFCLRLNPDGLNDLKRFFSALTLWFYKIKSWQFVCLTVPRLFRFLPGLSYCHAIPFMLCQPKNKTQMTQATKGPRKLRSWRHVFSCLKRQAVGK